jgi:hypothetical protein
MDHAPDQGGAIHPAIAARRAQCAEASVRRLDGVILKGLDEVRSALAATEVALPETARLVALTMAAVQATSPWTEEGMAARMAAGTLMKTVQIVLGTLAMHPDLA